MQSGQNKSSVQFFLLHSRENRRPQRPLSSFVGQSLLLAFVLALAPACATPRPVELPRLTDGEESADLISAHHKANKAYASCHEEAQAKGVPLHAITSTSAFLAGTALVAGGVGTAVVFLNDPVLLPVGVGVAASSTALFATSLWSAFSISDDFHRMRIRDAALVRARQETMMALDDRDAAGLLQVQRNIYENCRIANIAQDGPSGDVFLRDYARYRRETQEMRQWHKELAAQLAAEKKRRVDSEALLEKARLRAAAESATESKVPKETDDVQLLEKNEAAKESPNKSPETSPLKGR